MASHRGSGGTSVGFWKESTAKEDEDVLAVQIWACHDLKTLRLSFKHHDLDKSPLQHQHKVLQYIPRACPRLEHLQIDLFKIDLVAESGLSLLSSVGSGLPALETLALGIRAMRAATIGCGVVAQVVIRSRDCPEQQEFLAMEQHQVQVERHQSDDAF
ncbi:unnamed protein product [Mortierella alpina]